MTENIQFCCESSLDAGEPLQATASFAQNYLLVEYRGQWGPKAVDDSTLPDKVKAHLWAAADALDPAKVLLIRHPQNDVPLLKFFAVDARAGKYYLYNFTEYRDLLQLNIVDCVRNARHTLPLFLICSNGKRDAACAKFGTPVFEKLFQEKPDDTWRCSHIGGHRFAPTGIFLPHGVVYGRLPTKDIVGIATAYENGRISTQHLRGRSIYPPHIQAAIANVTQNDAWMNVDRWKVTYQAGDGENAWRVALENTQTNQTVARRVVQRESSYEVRKSTTDTAAVTVPVFDVSPIVE